jgi:isoquinoline 1-oxidoreductase beta subunit
MNDILQKNEARLQAGLDDEAGTLSRRSLLQGAGAAAFVIAFHLPARGSAARHAATVSTAPRQFNGFLAIGTDNYATAIVAQAEMGQGSLTGITQLTAAELGADWSLMRYEMTTERRPEYINPFLYEGLVLTAGSTSITGFYTTIRTAAATTREMLTSAAAKMWRVDTATCKVANSFVIHAPSGRRFSFGELAVAASKEPVPVKPRLFSRDEMPLLGQPLPRVDSLLKSTGAARYGLDARVPGMLYAAVRHGASYGADVATLDATMARTMPGVKLVMAVPQGVAVVADHYWQAVNALKTVRETYVPHENDTADDHVVEALMRKGLLEVGYQTPGSHGDTVAGMKTAVTIIDREYHLPLMAHACIEPVSCTASVVGKHCEIWLSTKSSTLDAGFAAEALGIEPGTVIVHNEFLGGDFGRRSGREHVTEAVLLSKAVGHPVKAVWTRQEDLRIDQHRTAVLGHVRMGLGADGMPVAYEAKIACGGAWEVQFPEWFAKKKPMDLPVFGLVGSSYGIPHEDGRYVSVHFPVRVGPWRGNQELHNAFLLETTIDEAAELTGHDPLDYRLKLVAKDPRSVAVIKRAAELSGYAHPAENRFQGLCFHHSSENWHSRMACIVELSKQDDAVKVERIILVCDSGLVINPNLARQCLEGGLIFGLSNSIHERITLEGGAPQQHNFNDYRVMRIDEAPEVIVEIFSVGDVPGAYGEISSTPVGPALGAAIFKATGKRLRAQPFALQGVKFV